MGIGRVMVVMGCLTVAGGQVPVGNREVVLRYGGRERSYLVHVPTGGAGPFPVVIAFHGGGGNASGFARYAGLDRLADREGFVVVYPNGTGRLRDRLLTFNAGDCCGSAAADGVDDVGFVRAVVADLGRQLRIDRSRIYATGHSNGAMMAYRMAAEAADLVAAIAPVAGVAKPLGGTRPVPVLDIHSVDDPRALYAGGLGPPFPLTKTRVPHQPVAEVLAAWARRNGCQEEGQVIQEVSGSRDGVAQRGELLDFGPCHGAPLHHWRLHGVGHGWPGDRGRLAGNILGPGTNIVDAAPVIWAFVRQFRLSPPN